MGFLKNRTVLGGLSIAVALLVAFVAVPVVNNATSSFEPVVWVAVERIPQGTELTASHLKVVEMEKDSIPAGAIRDTALVVGKYAAMELALDDILTPYKATATEQIVDGFLYDLPDGMRAMSVSVKSFAGGVSGKLRAGDIVSVYVTVDENLAEQYEPSPDITPATLPPELVYVEVLAVSDSHGSEVRQSADQLEEDEEVSLPATVTLLVADRQAEILAGLERNRAHIAFVTRDEAKARLYLEVQEEYLLSLEEEGEEEEDPEGEERDGESGESEEQPEDEEPEEDAGEGEEA